VRKEERGGVQGSRVGGTKSQIVRGRGMGRGTGRARRRRRGNVPKPPKLHLIQFK
jgi:hypothetical protein